MRAPITRTVQGVATPRAHIPRVSHAPDPLIDSDAKQSLPKLASYVGRRPIVWAGGFAVIVIAGTILGAQLKSTHQAQERQNLQQTTRGGAQANAKVVSPDPGISVSKSNPSSTELSKQITFLEERRNALLSQKVGLEQKLEEVTRKQKLEEEMQARKERELGRVR